jgi:hypothetical protein
MIHEGDGGGGEQIQAWPGEKGEVRLQPGEKVKEGWPRRKKKGNREKEKERGEKREEK